MENSESTSQHLLFSKHPKFENQNSVFWGGITLYETPLGVSHTKVELVAVERIGLEAEW